ncbi:PAS domain-containing sensor histidine kinase [Saccharicrinis sp. FJH62]|uniref:sensor histidine kinase n=1 Tax=Saccharicrinis sp. FJH62 TaxID=3344657 RepID=UPI0035D4F0DA
MKTIYDTKTRLKLFLMVFAGLIVVASMIFSNLLAKRLSIEERKKMELTAEAYKMLSETDETVNLSLILTVLQNNTTIPLIIIYHDTISTFANIRIPENVNQEVFLKKKAVQFAEKKEPIQLETQTETGLFELTLYYNDSILLKQLQYYPYVQLGLIAFFFVMAYLAFSFSKKAEENQVWVGLSKETAHQLGTPLSSLMAWTELMKTGSFNPEMIPEMEKDLNRLNMVTERFSKIGSMPSLEQHNYTILLLDALAYMRSRTSKKINIISEIDQSAFIPVEVNRPLFEWVIENIIKNAIDATTGVGEISIVMKQKEDMVITDFTDNGKGIPKKRFKTIFNPGFTTKKRGWGLGLSLTKRIVENYHHGKIFVKWSELDKGTTIRVILPILKS